jgi:hypothetical protein
MGQQPEHGADIDDKSFKYAQRCRKEQTWLWIVDSRQYLEYAPQLSWRVKERPWSVDGHRSWLGASPLSDSGPVHPTLCFFYTHFLIDALLASELDGVLYALEDASNIAKIKTGR